VVVIGRNSDWHGVVNGVSDGFNDYYYRSPLAIKRLKRRVDLWNQNINIPTCNLYLLFTTLTNSKINVSIVTYKKVIIKK
jgi:hypothetical protein